MRFIFRVFMAVNATSWVIVVYGIKDGWSFWCVPPCLFGLVMLLITALLSGVSLLLARNLSKDTLGECKDVEEVNSSFLPTYLGYFFAALSVNNITTLVYVFAIISIFTFRSQSFFFNPMFFMFGYQFYKVTTYEGIKLYIITTRGLRSPEEAESNSLRRLSDTVFIEWRGDD